MLHKLAPGRGICNIGVALRADGTVRWWPLQQALDHVVRRHPALRARFRAVGSQLRRWFVPPEETEVAIDVLAGAAGEVNAQLVALVGQPFDVDDGPLLRAHLITAGEENFLCLVLHHLVADMTSVEVIIDEVAALYDWFAGGVEPAARILRPGPLHIEDAPTDDSVAYWIRHLAGVDTERLAIAGARPAPTRPTFAGDRVDHLLSEEAVAAIRRLRERTRSTDNIVLLAAYYLLLARHGAGPDLTVGVPVNGRTAGVAENVVGFHANTVAIRVTVDPETGFDQLVRVVRNAFLAGIEHRGTSFEDVQHALGTRSEDWRIPLFRHMFNYRPTEPGSITLDGVPVEVIDVEHGMSRLDLELNVWVRQTYTKLSAVYSTEVHDRATVANMLVRYENLLIAVDAAADRPVHDVDLRTEADRALVAGANDTARQWPPGTVADHVVARAEGTPDAAAIGKWTYRELVAAAEDIRDELVSAGVATGDVVGLYAGRGPWLAAAVLGTWAAGAGYLPLDPAHPVERLAYQLADSGVRVVLADRAAPAACVAGRSVRHLDEIDHRDGREPLSCRGDLAYVSYTSGSTGRPKGVAISHHALANVVLHFAGALDVTAQDRMVWLTTFSFDISALELLVPLVAGGQVVIADDAARLDSAVLAALIEGEGVTLAQATPTTWRQVAPRLRDRLRGCRVLCGGEPLTAALAEHLFATGARVFNVYGPTETTIWSTMVELSTPLPEHIPIGRPIANTTAYVLDDAGRTVPPGLPGELCIGGTGLAIGYRGDPERTAQRFRVDRHGRHYRTGDQVRQLPDGQFEFLGRDDRQAKVRGQRIELGEVEAVLEEHPEVAAAAVLTEHDPAGYPRLVAVVVPAGDSGDDLGTRLRLHTERWLTSAGVPARFAVVAALPMTGNDKVDYRAVAALAVASAEPAAGADAELPTEPLPRLLVTLWREVLGDPGLTATSNFFLAGGHSLSAVELAEKVSAATGHAVGFDAVFQAPTPARLAADLSNPVAGAS